MTKAQLGQENVIYLLDTMMSSINSTACLYVLMNYIFDILFHLSHTFWLWTNSTSTIFLLNSFVELKGVSDMRWCITKVKLVSLLSKESNKQTKNVKKVEKKFSKIEVKLYVMH